MWFNLLVVFLVCTPVFADDLIVQTLYGAVQGGAGPKFINDIRHFKGIPYAKAPVGDLRFMPTEPFDTPWNGTRDALVFSDDCPQHGGGMSNMNQSEDCLYLNVWAPRANSQQQNETNDSGLPVMVFFYGGTSF